MTERSWTFHRAPAPHHKIFYARHWGPRKREADNWMRHVVAVVPRPILPITCKVALKIYTRRYRRAQDPDNAVAACKPLIDALNRRGWLVDDSSDWLELEVNETSCRRRQDEKTVVIWREADGGESKPSKRKPPSSQKGRRKS